MPTAPEALEKLERTGSAAHGAALNWGNQDHLVEALSALTTALNCPDQPLQCLTSTPSSHTQELHISSAMGLWSLPKLCCRCVCVSRAYRHSCAHTGQGKHQSRPNPHSNFPVQPQTWPLTTDMTGNCQSMAPAETISQRISTTGQCIQQERKLFRLSPGLCISPTQTLWFIYTLGALYEHQGCRRTQPQAPRAVHHHTYNIKSCSQQGWSPRTATVVLFTFCTFKVTYVLNLSGEWDKMLSPSSYPFITSPATLQGFQFIHSVHPERPPDKTPIWDAITGFKKSNVQDVFHVHQIFNHSFFRNTSTNEQKHATVHLQ